LDIFDKAMELPGLRRFRPVWQKHREVLLYLFFGALTTAVSIGSFALCNRLLAIHELVANVISWVCAVTFAYVTNRVWVFASGEKGAGILKEAVSFFGGRLTTLLAEEGLLFVFVTVLSFPALAVKLAAQIFVLVANYFISKFLVFRKKQ